jgi:hypothetical protein
MTTFSAAAAAALDVTGSHLGQDLFSYGVILRLDVEKNGRNAPPIVSQLIATMLLEEPSLIVYDANDNRFDNDAFPSDKESFDLAFAPSTQRKSLRCYFSVTTTRRFHQLKVSVWDLLQRHRVFLDRSPGPTNKRNLVAMGFWLHVHPGFASPRAFGAQINADLNNRYHHKPAVLAECGLPETFNPPEIYFSPAKCHGTLDDTRINSNALCMYTDAGDADTVTNLITRLSSFADSENSFSPFYVPFALKTHHPDVYGAYLAKQNNFLENHRNIAIAGVSVGAMDHGDEDNPDDNFTSSLWQRIKQLDGVYRADSCRRTPDLGKWNISCHSDFQPTIAAWLDDNVVNHCNKIPVQLPTFKDFPAPTRLSAARNSRSVSSGLTDASPVSHYLKTLANRTRTSEKIKTVLRNPWKSTPPVAAVQYTFTPTEYPKLPTTKNGTARTEDSTYAPSAVTSPSFSIVEAKLDSQLSDIEKKRKADADAFRSRMDDLEDGMTQIRTDLDQLASTISTEVTRNVLLGLQGVDGVITQQNRHIAELQEKLMQLIPLVQEAISPRPASPNLHVTSPPRKNQKLNDAKTMDGVNRQ